MNISVAYVLRNMFGKPDSFVNLSKIISVVYSINFIVSSKL